MGGHSRYYCHQKHFIEIFYGLQLIVFCKSGISRELLWNKMHKHTCGSTDQMHVFVLVSDRRSMCDLQVTLRNSSLLRLYSWTLVCFVVSECVKGWSVARSVEV